VTDTEARFPSAEAVAEAFAGNVAEARFVPVDRLGDRQFANLVLVGAAYQLGALPISAAAIERAITLNGVAVEKNVAAFRRGRRHVVHPDAGVSEYVDPTTVRVAELTAYQNGRYADAYASYVDKVRAREESVAPGSTRLGDAVARNLYKLMAYKDEYEVARLSLAPELTAAVEERFGRGARVTYKLHPPLLRAMGMKKKLGLGSWARPALVTLRALRRVRGTPLDLFGYTEVRRVERALVVEYRQMLDGVLDDLAAQSLDRAVELAALPDLVRGYEDIKLRNVERYRERMRQLLEPSH
jgi:indolepyruvate ferredoxin oxidoreductase